MNQSSKQTFDGWTVITTFTLDSALRPRRSANTGPVLKWTVRYLRKAFVRGRYLSYKECAVHTHSQICPYPPVLCPRRWYTLNTTPWDNNIFFAQHKLHRLSCVFSRPKIPPTPGGAHPIRPNPTPPEFIELNACDKDKRCPIGVAPRGGLREARRGVSAIQVPEPSTPGGFRRVRAAGGQAAGRRPFWRRKAFILRTQAYWNGKAWCWS